eukprot:CAMPEP_0119180980 /NCGR_PEP_ID=MMETSP1315-20130426/58268_1 /TAXON_ID=676789 /ORGANISM="Prasinoderma singularis, Strain RCC927" /LENGTH=52 /DNA_ID=CAMNT_0007175279 /DNA_START=32 /DNA_END=187 /DNA_ORIENTATION=+
MSGRHSAAAMSALRRVSANFTAAAAIVAAAGIVSARLHAAVQGPRRAATAAS